MKKFGFFISMLLVMPALFSQPVLNNSLNFSIGDTYQIDGYYDVPVIDPGPPGVNQVWDFEEIDGDMFIEGEPGICVDPATTPFADSAAVMASTICTKLLNYTDYGPYVYYNNTNSFSEMAAMGYYEAGNTSYGAYNPPYNYLKYPLSYGDSYDFTYDYLSYHLDFGYHYYHDSGYVHVEADAWGAITTPAGDFPNALRLKVTANAHLWYKFDISEPWMYMGEWITVSYQWFAPPVKVPVMIIHEEDFKGKDDLPCNKPGINTSIDFGWPLKKINPVAGKESWYTVQYLADYDFASGIQNSRDQHFVMGPNPAGSLVRISVHDGIRVERINIYNDMGQVVKSLPDPNHEIDVSRLTPGLYVVEVIGNHEPMRKKLVIKN
jgi:hypothetical protein